jgi:hypothetical protein
MSIARATSRCWQRWQRSIRIHVIKSKTVVIKSETVVIKSETAVIQNDGPLHFPLPLPAYFGPLLTLTWIILPAAKS